MSRRFQFSLKWSLAAMLVVAAFFGGRYWERHRIAWRSQVTPTVRFVGFGDGRVAAEWVSPGGSKEFAYFAEEPNDDGEWSADSPSGEYVKIDRDPGELGPAKRTTKDHP